MGEPKTKPTKASVTKFIEAVENETRREDAKVLLKMLKKITGKKPVMWGPTIIGFDTYHYKSRTQEGDWPRIGFSPRKTNQSIYIMPGFKNYKALLSKLGKHKHSVGCLYINKLADVDLKVLEKIMKKAYDDMNKSYP